VRTPSLPMVWALNHLRLGGPVTYEQVVELAEEHLGDLSYRQVAIEHQASAERHGVAAQRLKPPVRVQGHPPLTSPAAW